MFSEDIHSSVSQGPRASVKKYDIHLYAPKDSAVVVQTPDGTFDTMSLAACPKPLMADLKKLKKKTAVISVIIKAMNGGKYSVELRGPDGKILGTRRRSDLTKDHPWTSLRY